MRLNITEEYVPLKEFLELLNTTSNLKDVHLLCHQAGCPVYVIRDENAKCDIMWHPCINEERNTSHAIINDGIFGQVYAGKVQAFETLEHLQKDIIVKHMLGDNPFDSDYLIWSNSSFN